MLLACAPPQGMDKDDIDITVDEGILTVSAERKSPAEENGDTKFLIRERAPGRLTARVTLPSDADTSDIPATYNDGVLKIDIPRSHPRQRRRIKLK